MIPEFGIEYHLYQFQAKAGLTDRGLAELSGMNETQINQIEDSKANPTIHTMCLLSLALGVAPVGLLSVHITP